MLFRVRWQIEEGLKNTLVMFTAALTVGRNTARDGVLPLSVKAKFK